MYTNGEKGKVEMEKVVSNDERYESMYVAKKVSDFIQCTFQTSLFDFVGFSRNEKSK